MRGLWRKAWRGEPTRLWRWSVRLAGAWAVVAMLCNVVPGGVLAASALLLVLGLVVLGVWFATLQTMDQQWWGWARKCAAPLVLLLVAGLVYLNVPMRVAFAAHRPAFAHVTASAPAAKSNDSIHRTVWVGMYRATAVGTSDHMVFYVNPPRNDAGYVYSPEGNPGWVEGNPVVADLGGGWYAFDAGW